MNIILYSISLSLRQVETVLTDIFLNELTVRHVKPHEFSLDNAPSYLACCQIETDFLVKHLYYARSSVLDCYHRRVNGLEAVNSILREKNGENERGVLHQLAYLRQ